MSEFKNRKNITLEKLNAIQRIDKDKLTPTVVAAVLGINRSTVSKCCSTEKENRKHMYLAIDLQVRKNFARPSSKLLNVLPKCEQLTK